MTITLTPDQERAIQRAIKTGVVRDVDEFIEGALAALTHQGPGFDKKRATAAAARIRELRRGVRLDLRGMSIRDFAHIGHRY
ncbi:MAG TPA: hypothetical protein VEJ86_11475 [Candidatus Binataceae bacterium]|nr:hypothetical protein [Candidatus Binataceae bacterium]